MRFPSFSAFCIGRDSANYEPPIFLSFLHWKGLGSSFLFIYYLGKTCTTFIHLTWKSWNLWLPSSSIMVNHHWLLIWKISSCHLLEALVLECMTKLTGNYPAPRLNVRVFFFVQKETPTSWLKGVDEGLSPLYLRCLGIWNNACTSSTGLYSKAYNRKFHVSWFRLSPLDFAWPSVWY